MSGEEFGEWMAYCRVNPFTEGRMDWRFAMLASVMASGLSGKEWGIEEFMPKLATASAESADVNWEAQLRKVEMLNAMFGGEDLRGEVL